MMMMWIAKGEGRGGPAVMMAVMVAAAQRDGDIIGMCIGVFRQFVLLHHTYCYYR